MTLYRQRAARGATPRRQSSFLIVSLQFFSDMKTFADIQTILADGNLTVAAKKKALTVEFGLRPEDLYLLDIRDTRERKPGMAFTFGVEIECNVRRDRFEQAAGSLPYEWQGTYNHNDSRTHFRFVHDGSVTGADPIECVTPVLNYGPRRDGKKLLGDCLTALNAAGVKVNVSCGLHVHIGAEHLTDEQFSNVFANYLCLESLIDSFMAKSRRGDGCTWCHTLKGKGILDCRTRRQVRESLDRSRYHKVNPMSGHGTIEFRQHQGSTDFDKIFNWVIFCGKLVEWSKDNRLDREIDSIDAIPFLTKKEKAFFKSRQKAFADREARRA